MPTPCWPSSPLCKRKFVQWTECLGSNASSALPLTVAVFYSLIWHEQVAQATLNLDFLLHKLGMMIIDLIPDLWGGWNEMVSVKPGMLKEPEKHKDIYYMLSWVLFCFFPPEGSGSQLKTIGTYVKGTHQLLGQLPFHKIHWKVPLTFKKKLKVIFIDYAITVFPVSPPSSPLRLAPQPSSIPPILVHVYRLYI